MKKHILAITMDISGGEPVFGGTFLSVLLFYLVTANAAVTYLDNGTLTIGVDLNRGGTITYLKDNSDGRDIVNNYDLGREIQQSYYSGPTPYDPCGNQHPGWPNWPWNPVAAGDAYGNNSTVLNWSNDGHTIYVKRKPKQWALYNIDAECTMEEWISLGQNAATVRCRLNNNRSDTTFYSARPQELPAVYTNGDFRYLFTYGSDAPFTNDSLREIVNSGPPWEYFYATENWSALVDSSGWGLGVYHPEAQLTGGGYHPGFGSDTTGYISPLRFEHIDYNIVYEYEYYLIVDDLTGIRSWVYQRRPNLLPDYIFKENRQGWILVNTTDPGFPWLGFMRLDVNRVDPQIHGPYDFWDADDVPELYIKARYNLTSAGPSAQVFFNEFGGSGFRAETVITFPVINDGQWHTYAVDMSSNPNYVGKISQIRFDPTPDGSSDVGQYVDIECISAYSTSTSEAANTSVAIGQEAIVPNTTPNGVPTYPWFPDGHITLLPGRGLCQMYWAGSSSYRTTGTDVVDMNDPGPAVIGPGPSGSYDNGGAWLYSVFQKSGSAMLGFYHTEDHEFPPDPNPDNIAWKSIALCTSSDAGASWTKHGQIITSSNPKPSYPQWGGNGDHCVVYDADNSRWVCYYAEHFIYMAVSYDPDGMPGTWYKYYNGDFAQPGLGGENSPVPGLQNYPGGNPSVHYNTYLDKWVMVWNTWDGPYPGPASIWLSTSTDMVNWDTPIHLIPAEGNERLCFPTIIGSSDIEAGQSAWLYYAYWPNKYDWRRQFLRRRIVFEPGDINGDKKTNYADLTGLASCWLRSEPSADIAPADGDGIINFLDFSMLSQRWLQGVE